MIGWRSHLGDRRLVDYCTAERSGEALDLRAAEHLADCDACRARHADMTAIFDTVRQDAEADTDAAFPADRLLAQRQQIARRLEQLAQSARVISFPVRETRDAPETRTRMVSRWVAAGVAAGLFVGLGVGVLFNPRVRQTPAALVATAPSVDATIAPPAADVPETLTANVDDDAMFLSTLEDMRERRFAPELHSLDEVTPHIRDISFQIQ